jgi:hypothetical protein
MDVRENLLLSEFYLLYFYCLESIIIHHHPIIPCLSILESMDLAVSVGKYHHHCHNNHLGRKERRLILRIGAAES